MKHKRTDRSRADGSHEAADADREAKSHELKELREAVESLQKDKDELFAKLQRVSADYANFQKRVPKQIADTLTYEKERLIKTLLPALDNFEHTLQKAHSAEDVDVLVKGVRIIYDQMLDILKSHNVERIEALGATFDPAVHEAMTQQSDPEKEENVVLEEFQSGYRLNGRVIRPSKVIVNRRKVDQQADKKGTEPAEQVTGEREAADEYETTDLE